MSNRVYDDLLRTMPQDLEQQVLHVIASADGRAVGRRELVERIFGYTPANLANDRHDRQIRKAIEALQLQGYPIISSSGKGGYRMANEAEIDEYIRELEARRARLAEKIRALREAKRRLERWEMQGGVQARLF